MQKENKETKQVTEKSKRAFYVISTMIILAVVSAGCIIHFNQEQIKQVENREETERATMETQKITSTESEIVESEVETENDVEEQETLAVSEQDLFTTGYDTVNLPSNYDFKVNGMTDSIQNKMGEFHMKDFIRDCGNFLYMNKYQDVEAVTIEKEVLVSAENAVAFKAIVNEDESKTLLAVYYPEYEGYIFAFDQEVKQNENDSSDENNMSQTELFLDSTSLTIKDIPDNLLATFHNPEDFRSSLYEYLRNQNLDTDQCSVEYDYSSDANSATFIIDNAEGEKIKAVYNIAENNYMYELQ